VLPSRPASDAPPTALGAELVGAYAIRIRFSDGHDTGIYSWDLLYDYGKRQDEMWQHYLKRVQEAGASREPRKP
jgi:DUF971 family protein